MKGEPRFEGPLAMRKRTAREVGAVRAQRRQFAQESAERISAAKEAIMAVGLDGKPVHPAIREEALERVRRKSSLRPRSW